MEGDGLTNEQVEKVLQFQDLTGINDMNVCRDILIRHQWDLEVAIQEQLNIREGRPTMYAASHDIRAPAVVNENFFQQVFSANMPGGRSAPGAISGLMPHSITGIFGYLINMVFQYCYSTVTTILNALWNLGGTNQRIVTDPLGDVISFINAYKEKYPTHPVFYQGTYAQALNDAKQELHFLLVYIHKDPSSNINVDNFCNQTLSNLDVIEYINQNTLFWGCDVSTPEGYRVAQSINARCYPIMALIGLRANRMTVMGRFEGDCTAEELVRRLQVVILANSQWLSQARAERLERNFTQTLRRQQDEAYQQSLRADEEKERLRQLKLDAEREAREKADQEREEAKLKKARINQLKIDLAEKVPTEPPVDALNTISVVFKLPSGARIERRFRDSDSLLDVYNYLFCHPSSPDEFEITTNFPKRVLYSGSSTCNSTATETVSEDIKTLAEVGLKKREVLFINDLEA